MNKKIIGIIVVVAVFIIAAIVISKNADKSGYNEYTRTEVDMDTIDKSDIVITAPTEELTEYTGNKVLDTAILEIENKYNYTYVAVADALQDSLTGQTFNYVIFESVTSERHEFVLRELKDGTVAVQELEETIH